MATSNISLKLNEQSDENIRPICEIDESSLINFEQNINEGNIRHIKRALSHPDAHNDDTMDDISGEGSVRCDSMVITKQWRKCGTKSGGNGKSNSVSSRNINEGRARSSSVPYKDPSSSEDDGNTLSEGEVMVADFSVVNVRSKDKGSEDMTDEPDGLFFSKILVSIFLLNFTLCANFVLCVSLLITISSSRCCSTPSETIILHFWGTASSKFESINTANATFNKCM
jgi:hypothetical protein